jgi:hypothetical protein
MTILKDIKLDTSGDIGKDFLKSLMGGRLNPQIERMLEEKKDICIKNISPKIIYEIFKIDKIKGNSVYFNSGHILNGPNISKILKGSEITAIFIFTLGSGIDDMIEKTSSDGDTLATIIMDSITTSMLTILGKKAGELIKKEGIKKDNWSSTCTYSPGQFKWTIEEQKEIFNMVDGSRIGVKLNKSYLMIPFKSISGVYGFGPKDKIDKTRVACDICPRKNCIGRR